jgi:PAS domain S-box-containing protein
VIGCVLVFRDVTEHRRVAKEIRDSEARKRAILEAALDCIITMDHEGKVVEFNPAAEKTFGYSRAEVIGRELSGFIIPHSLREQHRKGMAHYLATGEGPVLGRRLELPALRADGSEIAVELAITRISTDGPPMFTAYVRDIGERKMSEAKILAQEQRTRTILESFTDAFCSLDRNWHFVYVNQKAEELLGRSRDSLLGKHLWEEFAPAVGTAFDSNLHRAMDENVTTAFEAFYPQHDRWYEVHAYPSPDGLSVYFRDSSLRRKAEEALRENEEKLRLLANTIPQLAWMARPEGDIFWYNRRWYEYTGTVPEQMEGWGWQSVHHPDTLPAVLERWKASIASGEPFDMVFPLKGADEQFRPFLTRVNPLRDQEGKVLYWFGTNTDISDQMRAEEALRGSEERFRQLADAMPQLVWTVRSDGEIDYRNRQWYEFTGMSEAVGNEGWEQILHPDDSVLASERWASSIGSGDTFDMEIRLLDRSTQAYRWHLIRTVAARDTSGKVARWYGTGTDIDAQKRSAEASRYLAEASAALAGVVDYESTLQKVANLAVPYFADWSSVDVANNDGTLRRLAVAHRDSEKIRLAHELMQQYPPDPHAPGGAFRVLRTGTPEIIGDITDDMLVQGAKDESHLTLIRSLGLKSLISVPLVVSGAPFGVLSFATAESGRRYTNADLALAQDLAHRAAVAIENTQLYQALRENDRRKDEFLATLAHELRNPLAPIRNSLQILKMPRVDAAMVERSRDMIERQVHHLVRLVDDLLDVSRVMRGKIELRKEKVELATVVARAIEIVQPLIDAQGHDLSVNLPSESLLLDADPVRLSQVVGNLLTNAAKYTDPKGHIWLTAQRMGDEAVLRIRDSGIGIAPDVLPHVFDLFVQVDHAAMRSQGGLGIGLTLVKNLLEMHGGTVAAHSAGLGKGSEFVVRLPVVARGLNRGENMLAGDSVPQSTPPTGHRLLIVDDNRDAADSLAMLLGLQGHVVQVAYSGQTALEMAKGFSPDAVFLDIGMPGMDGFEVARRLRQLPGLAQIVLAALTGWGKQEDRRRSSGAGFDHHLVKPPEPKAIEIVLASLKTPGIREQ